MKIEECSGVGTSCGLGGPRWVDKTMLISNETNKDRMHIYKLQKKTMG